MTTRKTPDPYCGFRDDHERRLALNVRAHWRGLQGLAAVLVAGVAGDTTGAFRWLMHWFH